MRLAVVANILKQILPWQILAACDDPLQIRIGDRDLVDDAMLAGELHHQLVAALFEMAVAQRRRAEALVRLGILFVADPDMLGIEQPHHRRQHRVAR